MTHFAIYSLFIIILYFLNFCSTFFFFFFSSINFAMACSFSSESLQCGVGCSCMAVNMICLSTHIWYVVHLDVFNIKIITVQTLKLAPAFCSCKKILALCLGHYPRPAMLPMPFLGTSAGAACITMEWHTKVAW